MGVLFCELFAVVENVSGGEDEVSINGGRFTKNINTL